MMGLDETTEESAEGIEEVGEAADGTSNSVTTLGDMIKANLLSTAVAEGLKALVKGIKEVAEAAVGVGSDFEASMSQVAATMGMTSDEIQSGSAAYVTLEEAAKHCGETTKYSASEAAEALNYLALAGYDASKAAETLPKVLDLAAAGGMDLATASDLVTDAMAALGMETSELDTYIDEMARTAQKSNTSVQQLGEATLVCAGMAKTAGVDLETMNTALGVLANNGIKGAEGGTHLRNVLISLSAPTDTASAKLRELGVETEDAAGNMRPLEEIIIDLNNAVSSMGTAEKAQAIRTIFNKTDIAAVNALLKSTNGEFDNLKEEINNAAGAASDMAKTMNDNLKGQVTILKSNLEALGISAYQVFDGELKKGVQAASDAVQRLNESVKSGDMNTSLNRISEAMGELIEKTSTMVENVLPDVINAAAWCIENFDLIAAGVTGIATASLLMNKVAPAITLAREAWLAYKAETEGATVAQWLLNTAMNANPVGIIVTALAALTAGLAAYSAITKATTKDTEVLSDEQKKLVDAANSVTESSKKSAEARKTEYENMAAQRQVVANLRNELATYVDANGRVTDSSGRVQQIVNELNTIMPELGLAYDATSQSISMTTDEIERNTEAMLRQAETEAIQEQLVEIMRERIEVEQEMAKMEDEYAAATDELTEKQAKFREELAAVKEAYDEGAMGALDYQYAREGLLIALGEETEAANEVRGAYGELEGRLGELSEEEEYLTSKVRDNSDALSESGGAAGEYSNAMVEAASAISEAWAEEHDSMVKSIQGQIDLFSEYTAQTAISKDEILKNMREQVAGLEEWSSNLQELSRKGISEGLLQEMTKMGPEGAAYVAAFNEMTAAELQEASKLFEDAMTLPDETLTAVEENYSSVGQCAYNGYRKYLEEHKEEVKEASHDDLEEINEYAGDGAIEGLESKESEIADTLESIGKTGLDALKTVWDEHSPSKKFKEIGQYAIEGLANGIKEREDMAREAATQMADATKESMREGMNPDYFFSMGEMAGEGFVQGLLSKMPEVIAAAQKLADAAQAIVASALEINSPSKVFERLGAYTGEGFIVGFEDSMGDFNSVVNNMIPTTEDIDRPEYTMSNAVTNYFTINGAEGQDVTEIAYAVQDILNDQLMAERGAFA